MGTKKSDTHNLIKFDNEGYVVNKSEEVRLSDGYGEPIKKENLARTNNGDIILINLKENNLGINSEGFIVNNGNKISKIGNKESFVPINNEIALVRNNRKAISKYSVITRWDSIILRFKISEFKCKKVYYV